VGFLPLFPVVGVPDGVAGGVMTGAMVGTTVVPVVGTTVGPPVGTPGVGAAVTGATVGVVAPEVGEGDCVVEPGLGLPVGSVSRAGVRSDSFV
jgi:hypothetical protein